jgi:hypothetical protein
MNTPQRVLTQRVLRTPRAAAIAGIIFALLLSLAYILIRVAVPPNLADEGVWLESRSGMVTVAVSLVPFAGIAFLWFMGVVRDRLGHLEDQFFSTVFYGSGLLFLAMTFVSAALVGGIVASYAVESTKLIESGVYSFSRAVMYRISNVYAIRMAAVFMISIGTIWIRTEVMPRLLALLTYALALILLVTISYSLWVTMIFPGWVLVISIYILVLNLRSPGAGMDVDPGAVEA